MSNMRKRAAGIAVLIAAGLMLVGCASNAENEQITPAPTKSSGQSSADLSRYRLPQGEDGTPELKVYVVKSESVETMGLEEYVEGVLAGEMKNDWPLEALKAQAILARTFVLKFVAEKESKYEGAQISTDIEEAQAYDASAVNSRIKQAVDETRGMVLVSSGELPYAWFHAHSGGMTALAKEGLGWDKAEPEYTQVVEGTEPESGSDELKSAQAWEASFTADEFIKACSEAGAKVKLEDGAKLEISERGESGRAVTISINGADVNASALRISIGSTKMRSTMLTSLRCEGGAVIMSGKGYGHGVGMSQWGAFGMAQAGKSAEEIIEHYFKDVSIELVN